MRWFKNLFTNFDFNCRISSLQVASLPSRGLQTIRWFSTKICCVPPITVAAARYGCSGREVLLMTRNGALYANPSCLSDSLKLRITVHVVGTADECRDVSG